MFGKGPMPGATPKADALKLLPAGTHCKRKTGLGITGYVVCLPDGKGIAAGANANDAWALAASWARRQQINHLKKAKP